MKTTTTMDWVRAMMNSDTLDYTAMGTQIATLPAPAVVSSSSLPCALPMMTTLDDESFTLIPNKSNFKFQELTPITGVKPYVIRFWETEFDDIAPLTSDLGQKIYARKDVEAILKIKKLLFDEKMSIPEARMVIKTRDFSMTASETIQMRETHHQNEMQELQEKRKNLQLRAIARELILSSLELIREIKARHHWEK